MTDFFQRLKQRKLVQWAVAYVAAAFALLQGIDIIAQRFGWPDGIEWGLILASCQHLLEIPYDGPGEAPLTPALLRLDPDFDSLRGDPRFDKLCQEKQP